MSFFEALPLTSLPAVGVQRASLLAQELGAVYVHDLLWHLPFRYEDRTTCYPIATLHAHMPSIVCRGRLLHLRLSNHGKRPTLQGFLVDESGRLPLVWFHQRAFFHRKLQEGQYYEVIGTPTSYRNRLCMIHPEMQAILPNTPSSPTWYPIYSTTSKLARIGLHSKGLMKLIRELLQLSKGQWKEYLPLEWMERYHLPSLEKSFHQVHHPQSHKEIQKAHRRLKFQECLIWQLRMLRIEGFGLPKRKGFVFQGTHLLHKFYHDYLSFSLTRDQQQVVREIYQDMRSGHAMHRLLQGDVGCGKTIVAFLGMLPVVEAGHQVAFLAPTETLAQQHASSLSKYAESLGLAVALLTGSTPNKKREQIIQQLSHGDLLILVGTHALLEEKITFQQLGLVIVDEQQRFGVAQRGKLLEVSSSRPHMLLMTATPIPRTLSLSLYHHLDYSTIQTLPPGRIPIKTYHAKERHRLRVLELIKKTLSRGEQVYVVYPRIKEGNSDEYKDLMDGYASLQRAFPGVHLGILHGRMKPQDKAYEMKRFASGETSLLVATTVIEVGIHVPQATLIVIENAECFGLAQLHQLRGRVGRSHAPGTCILMTLDQISPIAKERIETLCQTHDGFLIAEKDLSLRGAGNPMGVQQSGLIDWTLTDPFKDQAILQEAQYMAKALLTADPTLAQPEHQPLAAYLKFLDRISPNWSQIG